MARNWNREGIELGRRLAAELKQEDIRLPMELSAMLDDAAADGVRVVEMGVEAARLQQDDTMAAEAEQTLAEARAWLALHTAWETGRHAWEHEAWLVSEVVRGALGWPLSGEDNGELTSILGFAWRGEAAMDRDSLVRYAATTLAEGRLQLSARPTDAALARAVHLAEGFAYAYDSNHSEHIGYYAD